MSQDPPKVISTEDRALFREIERLLTGCGFEICAPSKNPQILKALRNTGRNLTVLLLSGEPAQWARERGRHQDEALPVGPRRILGGLGVARPVGREGRPGSDEGEARQEAAGLLESRSGVSSHSGIHTIALAESESLADSHLFVGDSKPISQIKSYIKRVAASESSILITGETGTGKEVVAGLILKNSLRRQKPFVCINCAAIPESLLESELFGYERGAFTGAVSCRQGKLELGNGGTVFLDEIGDMSLYAQSKILRVIESKEVQRLGGKKSLNLDVRIIAASNRDLDSMSTDDTFRKDLYFRLNVARVHIPPLRQRRSDIPLLFDHFIQEFNERFGREVEGFTDESLRILSNYDWPGNIRELKNLVEGAFLNLPARRTSYMDLPDLVRRRLEESEQLAPDERGELLSVLSSTHWNKSEAARQLKWSRMTLYRKMAKYQLI